jgi:hypothetical protein
MQSMISLIAMIAQTGCDALAREDARRDKTTIRYDDPPFLTISPFL